MSKYHQQYWIFPRKLISLEKCVPHKPDKSQRVRSFEVYLMLHLGNSNDPFLDSGNGNFMTLS